jgi:hypothetical protein
LKFIYFFRTAPDSTSSKKRCHCKVYCLLYIRKLSRALSRDPKAIHIVFFQGFVNFS